MRRLGLALALALLLPAAPAAALDRYVPMKVPPGPGPAKYDRVFVQQLGPAAARTVLVLVPGTNGGARISRIPRPTVVDDRSAAHLDPLSAAPGTNRFLKTVVPFLKRVRSR